MNSKLSHWLAVHQLLIRKFALLGWLYVVVLSVPYLIGLYGAPRLREHFGISWWVIPAVSLFVLATVAPMVYLIFLRRVENQLLRDQRRYHRTLILASSGMIRVKDPARLARLIVHVVNATVRLTHSGLFLYDAKENRYVLRAVRHRQMLSPQMIVEVEDPLIEVIKEEKDLVLIEELEHARPAPGNGASGRANGTLTKRAHARAWMGKLEARLIVPSFSGDRLLGFLVLGQKRNGERYSLDDIALFSGLANQAALAMENAMVFEELRESEANMIQSEKLASLGQLASGMAHEIHNPLTIISGEAQLFLARFKGQHERADQVLGSIIEECQRAADITRRILRFAKPTPVVNRLSELAPLDLKSTIEDSLALAGYQVKLERVECKVAVPDNLPQIRGNQNQIQEVLLNLILNACQAMGEQGGTLTFTARANGREVELKVADTGPGIPAGKLKKVFDPFYTTKQSGTGLGLFVCQRIIQSHGGMLDVSSAEGKGACFTLRLPLYQQPNAAPNGQETASAQSPAPAPQVPAGPAGPTAGAGGDA